MIALTTLMPRRLQRFCSEKRTDYHETVLQAIGGLVRGLNSGDIRLVQVPVGGHLSRRHS